MTRGICITIINSGKLKKLLRDWSTDNTSTTRRWNELNSDRGALSRDFAWNSMDRTKLVTPIASTDWNELKFGGHKSTLDCNLDFLCDLHSETDMTVLVSNDNDSLETSSLTSHSLLLNGNNLHDFIRQSHSGLGQKSFDDVSFLDWDRVSVNLLEGFDVFSLY